MSSIDYRQSGVDIDAQDAALDRIRRTARATFTPGVLSEIGSFGGLFALEPDRADRLDRPERIDDSRRRYGHGFAGNPE